MTDLGRGAGQKRDGRTSGDPRAVGTRQVSDTERRPEPAGRDEPAIAAVLERRLARQERDETKS